MSERNPCWPTENPVSGNASADPCPACGHLVWVHSPLHDCVECELLQRNDERKEWKAMSEQNPCYPRCIGQIAGMMGESWCEHCGHVMWLHSPGRACVACELLERVSHDMTNVRPQP